MAEREGFEPSLESPLNSISSAAPSTARPSLQKGRIMYPQPLYRGKQSWLAIRSLVQNPRSKALQPLHAQADAALPINFQHLDFDRIADRQFVAHVLHPLLANLRDMHHAIAAG